MKAELTLIPKCSIHPNKINIYNEIHWHPHKPVRKNDGFEGLLKYDENGIPLPPEKQNIERIINSDRKAHGIVSKTARRKIMKASDYLLLMAGNKTAQSQYNGRTFQFKIAFITLTLPSQQQHDDREIINKCLNQFIIEIKKRYQVKNYIWRAEKQKNGNIHFHILIDRYIYWQELRDRWNRIINKLNYVNQYRESQQKWHKNGFHVRKELLPTWPEKKQRQAYERGAKTHWTSPNTTDIHSVQKIRNIKQYISKYMTKQPETDIEQTKKKQEEIKQTGRIWGCNRELSNITGARTEIDNNIQDEIQLLLDAGNVHKYQGNYFTVIYIDYKEFQLNNLQGLFQYFSQYMFEHFGFPLQSEIVT